MGGETANSKGWSENVAKEVFRIAYPKTGAEKKKWAKEYGMNAYYAGKNWALRKKDA